MRYCEENRSAKGQVSALIVQIADKVEHFLEIYRRPDGSRWDGQDLQEATSGVVTESWLREAQGYSEGYELFLAHMG